MGSSQTSTLRRSSSAPPSFREERLASQSVTKELAHHLGRCTPCSYHVFKPDGCRRGNNCKFCHLCTWVEIKRRKKETAAFHKALRRGKLPSSVITGQGPRPTFCKSF